MRQNPHVLLTFGNVQNPARQPRKTTSGRRQKVLRTRQFLHFWLRNVLRAATACTFSTSQLQKCSEPGVSCTFWLRNVLRATTACTFSTSQLQKVLRKSGVFSFFTCKCASRHNGVQFSSLIWPAGSAPAALASLLFFSTLRSHKSLEKHSVSQLSYLFAHLDLLASETFSFVIFLLLFSSLTLPISAFHLSILSEVWLLNFLRLLDCITKLPSITGLYYWINWKGFQNSLISGLHFLLCQHVM